MLFLLRKYEKTQIVIENVIKVSVGKVHFPYKIGYFKVTVLTFQETQTRKYYNLLALEKLVWISVLIIKRCSCRLLAKSYKNQNVDVSYQTCFKYLSGLKQTVKKYFLSFHFICQLILIRFCLRAHSIFDIDIE